jgi:hypothetical protein
LTKLNRDAAAAQRIIEMSRRIRLYLPTLLPGHDSAVLDQVIETLLANAVRAPEKTATELERALSGKRVTRKWLEQAMSGARPSRYEERVVDVTTPPQPVYAPKYKCGKCGFDWYRRTNAAPPLCPRDGSTLTPDGATA